MRRNVALLVASIFFSLAVAELALHAVHPAWVVPYPPVCYWPQLYERWDPHGYRLHPARRLEEYYPPARPRRIAIHANAEGFRSARDFAGDDARPHVVVLGDSMVFGSGVEEGERFTERLEAMEPGWRVDNMGMVAYGTDLMLRALETVPVTPPPDVVVFAIFSHDVYRVMPEATGVGFPLPRYVLRDGQLVTVPYPARPAWSRLRLVEGARYVRWRYGGASYAVNAAILDRFRALADERRFVPAIVFLPAKRERWDDRVRRRWLAAEAARRAVAYLDVSDAVHAAGGEALYIPDDAHWNERGHAVVAEALHPFLAHLLR